jgi:hypothetical protein
MRIVLNVPASRSTLTAALEGLTGVNRVLLERARNEGRSLPLLYESGIRYEPELAGSGEDWQTYEQLLRSLRGDCEDLSCARAAELQLDGVPARAIVLRSGPRQFHAVVLRDGNVIEDPSKRLGMRKGQR